MSALPSTCRHHLWRTLALRCICLLTAVSSPGQAEGAWRSVLYPAGWTAPSGVTFEKDSFLQDFSYAGYERGAKAPPIVQGPVFDAQSYGADPSGSRDSTGAIQAAIDAAGKAGGGVVALGPGLYKVSVPDGAVAALRINRGGVVLRGAGEGRTQILNTSPEMRHREVILVAPVVGRVKDEPLAALSKDVLGPDTTVFVDQTDALRAGRWVELQTELTDDWVREHKEEGWSGAMRPKDRFRYLRKVLHVDAAARSIVLDVPLRYSLKVRDRARIVAAPERLEQVGIEDLSIASLPILAQGWREEDFAKPGTAGYEADRSQLIRLSLTCNSWVRHVSSFRPLESPIDVHQHSNGIALDDCVAITLTQLSFSRAQYGGANGNGYMYRLHNSQECLVDRCVSDTCRHGFVFSGFASSGNVLLRCVDRRSGRQLEADGKKETPTSGWGSDHHMWLSPSNLIDHCEVDQSCFVAMYRPHSNHFLTASHTVFWNTGAVAPLRGKAVISQQVHMGYVIGTRGADAHVSTVSATGKGVAQTEPVDFVEGVQRGEQLEPQSLYEDQLKSRLHRGGSGD